jgi:hypothetical protein
MLYSELAMWTTRQPISTAEFSSSQESWQDRCHPNRIALCHLHNRNSGIDAVARGDARLFAGKGVR